MNKQRMSFVVCVIWKNNTNNKKIKKTKNTKKQQQKQQPTSLFAITDDPATVC